MQTPHTTPCLRPASDVFGVRSEPALAMVWVRNDDGSTSRLLRTHILTMAGNTVIHMCEDPERWDDIDPDRPNQVPGRLRIWPEAIVAVRDPIRFPKVPV